VLGAATTGGLVGVPDDGEGFGHGLATLVGMGARYGSLGAPVKGSGRDPAAHVVPTPTRHPATETTKAASRRPVVTR